MSDFTKSTSNEHTPSEKQLATSYLAEGNHGVDQAKLMQGILAHVPTGIYVYRPVWNQSEQLIDFCLMLFNPLGALQLDRSTKVAPGESLSQLLHPITSINLLELAQQVYQTEIAHHQEIRYQHHAIDAWFKLTIARFDHQIILTLADITDLKQVQFQLQKVTATMQAMLDGSPIAIAFLKAVRDSTGAIVDLMYAGVNEKLADLSQRSRTELIGQRVLVLFPQARHDLYEDVRHVIETGEPLRFERYFEQAPVIGWFDVSIVKNDDGAILSFLDTNARKVAEQHLESMLLSLQVAKNQADRDLHRLKIAEEEVSRMLQQEREQKSQITQFISFVSHQFRNPMAGILLAAEALAKFSERSEDSVLARKVAQYAQQTSAEIQRLDTLLTKVLFKDRLQLLQDGFHLEVVELVGFCQHLVEKQRELHVDYQRVNFQCNLSQLEAKVDPIIVEQVLENLLSNGLKYSPESDKPVEFRLDDLVDQIRLTVKDYGIGIPEDEIDDVGKSFFRASNTSFITGIGLGLSLSRQLIQQHGGRLEIQSEQNSYTVLSIYLPKGMS